GVPLKITGPTREWINSSNFSSAITIATTNNASLLFYIGNPTGSGVSLNLSGLSINSPGYAKNLQIYGLPTLTNITQLGNFIGTIYAPQANFTSSGGGGTAWDISAAIVVKSVTINGRWNLHYDENLLVNGPVW